MLVALLATAGCGGGPAERATEGGTKSELERRLAEVPSEAERRLVMLDFLEREVKQADARMVASRSKLHEALAREAAVTQQVSEHKTQLDKLERDLSALTARRSTVERELVEAQALEARRDAARLRTRELEVDLKELTTGLPGLEAKLLAGRMANAAKIAELDRQVSVLAESTRVAQDALTRARELASGGGPTPEKATAPGMDAQAPASRPAQPEKLDVEKGGEKG